MAFIFCILGTVMFVRAFNAFEAKEERDDLNFAQKVFNDFGRRPMS